MASYSSQTNVFKRDPETGHLRLRGISVNEGPPLPWSQTYYGAKHQHDQSLADLAHQNAMADANRAFQGRLAALRRALDDQLSDIKADAISLPAKLKQERYNTAWRMLGQSPEKAPGVFGTLMRSTSSGPVGEQPEIPVNPVMSAKQVRDFLQQRSIVNQQSVQPYTNQLAERFRTAGMSENSPALASIRRNLANFATGTDVENEREYQLGLLAPNSRMILQRQIMRGNQALSRDREEAERLGNRIGFIGSLGSLIQ